MIFKKMLKNIITINFLIISLVIFTPAKANNHEFDLWVNNFKIRAVNSGISKPVVDQVMSKAQFLPKVIEYDRYQPEFYEDTFTYIRKRTNKKKLKKELFYIKKKRKL